MTLSLRNIVLIWGLLLFLSVIAIARPNAKICRNRNGKFPKPGTSCKGYYDCKNYVPEERECPDGEHFNANKGRCDWEDLYPCLEKQKDKECLRENGLFLKPGTNCKMYYRCCNGKAKVENCPDDTLFDPSKGNCEWPDLYTCIESLSTTEKVSSTIIVFETSKPPDDQKDKISTDPAISESTKNTTSRNRITYSTNDPGFERTNSRIWETSTKFNSSATPTDGESTFQTDEMSTISQTITDKISTLRPSTEIPTSLEPKEVSTPQPTTEIPTTLQPKEISTPRPSTENPTTLEPKEISTPRPTTEIPTTLEPKDLSTPGPTTEISITFEPKENSTPRTTTKIPRTLEPKEISTKSQPTTTKISTTEITSEPATSEISIISQTTSPQMSSSYSTDHTISKENKEHEITEPTIFETTTEITFSPSTAEETTSAELNIMCPEPTGHFPHPTDKHKFVACVNNNPYILDCPNDLVYKHHLRRCDYE